MSPTVYTTLPESSKVRAFEAVDPNEKKRRKKKAAWLIAVLFPYVVGKQILGAFLSPQVVGFK